MSSSHSQSAQIESVIPSRRIRCGECQPASTQFRASDLLVERFLMWKLICEALLSYFEGMSGIQHHTAKEFSRIGKVLERSLTTPLSSGLSCNETGLQGLRALLRGVRKDAHEIAQVHDALAELIKSSIVIQIQNLQAQVESNIARIKESCEKLRNLVDVEREKSAKSTKTFLKAIQMSKSRPRSFDWRKDPWYCNELLAQQRERQIYQESLLQKSVSILQTQSAQLEGALIRSIQAVWKVYQEHHDGIQCEVQPKSRAIGNWLQSLTPIAESEAFSIRDEFLLNPPSRHPSKSNYPGVGHPKTTAVYQGILQRKKKYKKIFEEGYYVVTPSGYMFQFKSASLTINPVPELSVFLPKCTLGEPTSDNSRFHQLSLLIDKKNTLNLEPVYTFRAQSHEELMEWWTSLKDFSKLCSPSPTFMTRNGCIETPVRDMAYVDRHGDSEHEDDSQQKHNSINATPVTPQDEFDIASDPSSDEPPHSTSPMDPDNVDRREMSEADDQMHPYRADDETAPVNSQNKVQMNFDLWATEFIQSAQSVRSNYGDEEEFFETHDTQQHQYDLLNTTSVTTQDEIEIGSAPLNDESTTPIRFDITTALDKAYENETTLIPDSSLNERNDHLKWPLIKQATSLLLPTVFQTKTALLPSLSQATLQSPRFQLGQRARNSM